MNEPLKILMLEDNPTDAEIIQRLLKKEIHAVRFELVMTADAFLKSLDQFQPDLILADNSLPQFNAAVALKIVREKFSNIPFILVTGTVSDEFAAGIIKSGADDYILKDRLVRLPAAIDAALRHRKIQKEKLDAIIQLKRSHEELRQLASRLQEIREEERTAMAREIHDELGQQLTILKMDVSWLARSNHITDKEDKQKLENLKEMLDVTVNTVRKIASELRPSLLDDLGLMPTMEWYMIEFSNRSNIKTQLFKNEITEKAIPVNAKTGLYRIFQESLTNIARHSSAANVSTSIEKKEDCLVLTIADDGKGFDPEKTNGKKTLGLLGMKERAMMLGGEFALSSKPGKGTVVSVSIPLESGASLPSTGGFSESSKIEDLFKVSESKTPPAEGLGEAKNYNL